MAQKIVAGNWKMNTTVEEAGKLASEIASLTEKEVKNNAKVIVCPPLCNIPEVKKHIENKPVALGAQNCHEEASGAYTGEVSAPMLKALGVEYVILGHSERREHFQESGEQLKTKVNIALEHNLTPVFCCGESLETRENSDYISFVKSQLDASLFHLDEADLKKVVIAYEPIWAIGTGRTATSDQAQEMHNALRQHIAQNYSEATAQNISILYGGSCKPSNAGELFACEDVDGGLIGGASLKSRDFADIINSFD